LAQPRFSLAKLTHRNVVPESPPFAVVQFGACTDGFDDDRANWMFCTLVASRRHS